MSAIEQLRKELENRRKEKIAKQEEVKITNAEIKEANNSPDADVLAILCGVRSSHIKLLTLLTRI